MHRSAIVALLLGMGLLLAACGETTGQRAATGGLGGAATGAAVGGPTGAVVGGAAGAGAGAIMDEGADEMVGDAID
ncbi:MAG TPA: hypothetical protein VFG47_11190 [Geminicoccaceae bacterium]|nr:hypothetical protein [Geminicoccaceae bacterium]